MRKVLIPHQQDLHTRYNLDGTNSPMIINQRFVDWVNSHPDMMACVMSYDDKYIDYLASTEDDVAVVLPGGMDIGDYPDRDEFESKLVQACLDNEIPLFGICKGMQIVNHVLGGTLKRVEGHWQTHVEHATTHRVVLEDGWFFDYLIQRRVGANSFHNWALDGLGEGIEVCGWSEGEEGIVPECIRVAGKPVIAVQWHPSYMISHPVSQALLELFYALPELHAKEMLGQE